MNSPPHSLCVGFKPFSLRFMSFVSIEMQGPGWNPMFDVGSSASWKMGIGRRTEDEASRQAEEKGENGWVDQHRRYIAEYRGVLGSIREGRVKV